MKINAIITGASGMVGEGVLHECIINPNVEQVLVIGRKPCGHTAGNTVSHFVCWIFYNAD